LNPVNHDDGAPGTPVLKQAFGDLNYLTKIYLRGGSVCEQAVNYSRHKVREFLRIADRQQRARSGKGQGRIASWPLTRLHSVFEGLPDETLIWHPGLGGLGLHAIVLAVLATA
jgi:hypothetical protein